VAAEEENEPKLDYQQISRRLQDLVRQIREHRQNLRDKICFEPWSTSDTGGQAKEDNTNQHNPAQTFYSLPSSLTEDVHCIEMSMLNCYGLQELYRVSSFFKCLSTIPQSFLLVVYWYTLSTTETTCPRRTTLSWTSTT
jgi:hypothetical protein